MVDLRAFGICEWFAGHGDQHIQRGAELAISLILRNPILGEPNGTLLANVLHRRGYIAGSSKEMHDPIVPELPEDRLPIPKGAWHSCVVRRAGAVR